MRRGLHRELADFRRLVANIDCVEESEMLTANAGQPPDSLPHSMNWKLAASSNKSLDREGLTIPSPESQMSIRRLVYFSVVGFMLSSRLAFAADEMTADWGKAVPHVREPGVYELTVHRPPESGRLKLPAAIPKVLRASLIERRSLPLPLRFEKAGGAVEIELPPEAIPERGPHLRVETATVSGQLPDGRIVLFAADAEFAEPLRAVKLSKDESSLEGWKRSDTTARWSYEATRPGRYSVAVNSSLADEAIEAEFAVGATPIQGRIEPVDDAFTTTTIGSVSIPAAGKQTFSLRQSAGPDNVWRVRSIVLTPISEGHLSRQEKETGIVVCHARDVTIHGVKVQWEPKPEKQTVGFWVNASDWISWDFRLTTPGEFEVEILQGCGKGHGGSEVELTVAETPLKFTVEDTGHFQNFVPRKIGRVKITEPGPQEIVVRPLKKKSVAVMDLRQVRLILVKSE